MRLFADRTDAGNALADRLRANAEVAASDPVVLGIPRGGVVVAAPVARALGAPLGVALVRKLGSPDNEEFAVGAIAEGVRVIDERSVRFAGASPDQLADVERREREELRRRAARFGAAPVEVAGRNVIIVDDGIATGATAIAACRSIRAQGAARIVLAVPVAPAEWEPGPDACDDYVCLHRMRDFGAVGRYYVDFTQTSDEEVERLLAPDLP